MFWIALVACFFLFVWILQHLSKRFGYDTSFFIKNIVWYFLAVFLFSRLFFVISRWSDMKFIKDPFEFFVMSNYNFSLFGAMFGFFLVMLINAKLEKVSIWKYIDAVVLSLFFVLPIGYIGALLGGQVYGRETTMGIEMLYTHSYTLVPYQVPVFPLPIVYSIVTFLTFCGLYILRVLVHVPTLIGYGWLLLFCAFTLILEFFSGKYDIFSSFLPFNLNQFLALILACFCAYQLYHIYISDFQKKDVVSLK